MRDAKIAIIKALAADPAVHALAPACYTVERAAVPQLPSIEAIAVSSERVGNGPMVRHLMDLECTVSHATEDGVDELLDGLIQAVRRRVSDAESATRPIRARGRANGRVRATGYAVEHQRVRRNGRRTRRARLAELRGRRVTGDPRARAHPAEPVGGGDCRRVCHVSRIVTHG